MKVFLWNDREWMFVDEGTHYDDDYVVARKLFVHWMTNVSVELLKERGKIQSEWK